MKMRNCQLMEMSMEKKTPDYLIVGDVQAKRENLHLVKQLLDKVEEIGLETIWLGDMLDRRGLIEAECLNTYYEYFKYSKLRHKVIVGNHDFLSMHSRETALLPLKALPNVWIIDSVTFLTPSMKTMLIPYYKDTYKFLEEINFSGVEYLIGHQGVAEFTAGSGYTENEAVSIEYLTGFKQVIMGHYHTPNEKDNVVFLGSPFSHSFSESNEVKRLGIFNEESGLISYIETDFPRHVSMEYNVDGEPMSLELCDPKDHTRIILKGKAESITKCIEPLKKNYPHIRFIEQPDTEGFQAIIKETQTSEQMFKTWLREVKDNDDIDVEAVGLKILKDSK